MQKRKLNYRFHNPNSVAATADYILKILIDANQKRSKERFRLRRIRLTGRQSVMRGILRK